MLWTGAFIVKIVIYLIFNIAGNSVEEQPFWFTIFSILLSIVTDMVPYFSILELKFIEIFKNNATQLWKKSTISNSQSRNSENLVSETQNDIENLMDRANLMPRTPLMGGNGTEENDNVGNILASLQNQTLLNGEESSGGDALMHINNNNKNQINASVQLANSRSSDKGSILNAKGGSHDMFKDTNSEQKGSSMKPSASDFFVISEQNLKMKLGIRRESATPDQRNKVSDQLLIAKGNFQILEVFNKPWYTVPKEKLRRLGVLHKATIKSKDTMKPSTGGSQQCIARVI